ncbi:putative mitochondrial outer membrane protein [Talaromyces proteolyticus]|uniref:Mitochondrial outer membrane protein n=1 Tax=Talaromyces proteolyticus TaxID=1131652 RepID=A0AAD4KH38_9EURO|nr:putative mitochondrial outer membrane protein [Talaromyces proteolyticus]KAH8690965.1 putative mitochondrial outer membrane protein [Talaromyces proteolyticus]
MGSPLTSDDEDIFNRLQQQTDPKLLEEQQQAVNERINAIYQKAQSRLAELIDENSTLPCTISRIQILNAKHTRTGFLERVFSPILSANKGKPYTLSEALREVSHGAEKLNRFDIFHEPISVFLDKPTDPNALPTDLDVYVSVREKSRILLKTGTDLGNAEGSAYGNLLWRNIFGGAESLNLNASLGTRTRSAYQAAFESPILSDPNFRAEIGAIASATEKPWASHEEVLKGGWAKLRWQSRSGQRHELAYNGFWRQVTGLAPNTSLTVRGDAGDSVKSSISHTWIHDGRNNPLLPSRGLFAKTVNEIAGWGPLKGDVAFWKSEIETQGAVPIPIPFIKGESGVSFSTGLRAGLLYPLNLDSKTATPASRVNDRFVLGGPTDVRGFRQAGLGPHDSSNAIGGDVYAAGSANLFVPLPRAGKETPLRLQAFVNGGRLLSLRTSQKETPKSNDEVKNAVASTLAELGNGLPSVAAGVGLVYAHPVARFELNFSLPIVQRKGEEGRKGLQLGIGINFL